MRSPVASGTPKGASASATFFKAFRFSGGTGSSYQPGWKRARAQLQGGTFGAGPVIEGKAKRVAERPKPTSSFAIGERIFHQKFGYGMITDIEGNKLEIDFKDAGVKKGIDSFVEPA